MDPCAGNGNFFVPIFYRLKEERSHLGKNIKKEILSSILYFNDINESRTNNIKKVFKSNQYNLNITNLDFLSGEQIRREIVPRGPKASKADKPLPAGSGSAPKRGLSKSLDLRLQLPLAEMNDGYFHLRERFINRLMKDGKKSVATKLFDESLEMFYETVQQTDEENLAKQIKSRKKSKDD